MRAFLTEFVLTPFFKKNQGSIVLMERIGFIVIFPLGLVVSSLITDVFSKEMFVTIGCAMCSIFLYSDLVDNVK